jgi:hypothetical protein
MFLLGILSIFQITLLPGLLWMKWGRIPKSNFIQNICYCFGLSLVSNYIGVFLLTSIGLYKSVVVYFIFFCEIGLAIYLYRRFLFGDISSWIKPAFESIENEIRTFLEKFHDYQKRDLFYQLLFALLAIVILYFSIDSLLWLIKVFKNNIGDIFQLGDAVKNWNPWGVMWASGHMPLNYNYGQLIPINYSITYIFMQNSEVQFFAAGFMPLFAIFILLLFVDLSWEYKNVGFLLALVFTRYMMKKFAGDVIDDGYVDIAIMFFYLLPIHALLKASISSELDKKLNYLVLGGLFTAAAAVTKQSGLSILVAYPVLAYLCVIRMLPKSDQKPWMLKLGATFLLALVIVLPWYIITALNPSGVKMLAQGFSGLPIYQESILTRMWNGVRTIQKYNILYITSLIALPFTRRIYRWLTTVIVFPYTFLWAIFLSYDTRNLTPVIPIVAMTAGLGIVTILEKLERVSQWTKLSRVKTFLIFLFLISGFVFISQKFPDEMLIKRQIELQRELFYPQLDDLIYAKLSEFGPDAKIASNGYPIDTLPGLKDNIIGFILQSPESLSVALDENPEIRLLIVTKSINPAITDYIVDRIGDGSLILVADMGSYLVVEVPAR